MMMLEGIYQNTNYNLEGSLGVNMLLFDNIC